jgi:transcription elongation factor Elf1
MGKRKSSKPPPKKAVEKIPTQFNCPYCNHENSVECEIRKVDKQAVLECRICMERYVTVINNLSEPIDVYSEWIDEAERLNEQ